MNRANCYERADAILDADDLLIVDLRCPTCEGDDWIVPCAACRGTGRRDVRVVDADLLRVVAKAALIRWQELVTDNGVTYRMIDSLVPEKRAQIEDWAG